MKIHEILTENIIRDYYTANIKAEVILDMILTPIIGEILTVIGQNNKALGISGRVRLLAKEFPMLKPGACVKASGEELKKDKEDEYNYRNCNADYLMCDEESVYFVELKTTQQSLDCGQMINYQNYLEDCRNKKFSSVPGADFIDLLNHVSQTGYSDRREDKPWGKTGKDDLKRLFEAIIRYPEYKGYGKEGEKILLRDGWAKEKAHHVDEAIAYLKKTRAVSSKKYLLTAGQMLDNMEDGGWWDCEQIKLLYLMPERLSEKEISEYCRKGIIFVTFQEIMEQVRGIYMETEKQELKDYWKWVMELLKQCGLY